MLRIRNPKPSQTAQPEYTPRILCQVIYIVDAADPQRFEESSKALEEVLSQAHLHD